MGSEDRSVFKGLGDQIIMAISINRILKGTAGGVISIQKGDCTAHKGGFLVCPTGFGYERFGNEGEGAIVPLFPRVDEIKFNTEKEKDPSLKMHDPGHSFSLLSESGAPYRKSDLDVKFFKKEFKNKKYSYRNIDNYLVRNGIKKNTAAEQLVAQFNKLIEIPDLVRRIDDKAEILLILQNKADNRTRIRNKEKLAEIFPLTLGRCPKATAAEYIIYSVLEPRRVDGRPFYEYLDNFLKAIDQFYDSAVRAARFICGSDPMVDRSMIFPVVTSHHFSTVIYNNTAKEFGIEFGRSRKGTIKNVYDLSEVGFDLLASPVNFERIMVDSIFSRLKELYFIDEIHIFSLHEEECQDYLDETARSFERY